MHKKAFTLLEIIISLVILSLCMLGLANIFTSAKRYIQHNRLSMAGGEVGKFIIDPLQQEVRQDTWNDPANGLSPDPLQNPHSQTHTVGGKEYTINYTATNITNPTRPDWLLRRVNATINWDEYN